MTLTFQGFRTALLFVFQRYSELLAGEGGCGALGVQPGRGSRAGSGGFLPPVTTV